MEEDEVYDVEFLTPARLKMRRGGVDVVEMVSVDIINKKVYDKDGGDGLSGLVFGHLDSVNSLPEDFFAASPDVVRTAADAKVDHDNMYNKPTGE